jgi:hypothetical protein
VKIVDLVDEYIETRSPGWLVLTQPQALGCCIDAARYYAAYGNIASISLSDQQPGAPEPGSDSIPPGPDPEPVIEPSLPIKALDYIDENTDVTVGEWAVIRPLFVLYAEKENAILLEASRGAGIDPYGRNVSEVQQDITIMESETLPNKAFSHAVIEVY